MNNRVANSLNSIMEAMSRPREHQALLADLFLEDDIFSAILRDVRYDMDHSNTCKITLTIEVYA